MRGSRVWTWTVVCLLGLVLAGFVTVPAAGAQAEDAEGAEEPAPPRRGPRTGAGEEGPRGMAGTRGERPNWDPVAMRYPEITWSALAFECGASDEQMKELQPVYKEVRDQLEAARAKARETRDFAGVAESYEQARDRLQTKLAATLNDEQKDGLEAWEKTCAAMVESTMGERRGGGGRRADAFYLDRTWAYLATGLGLGAEELAKLEPAYQAAWEKREAAAGSGDAAAITEAAEGIRASLESALRENLTAEQWAKMQEDMAGGRRAPGMRGARGAGGRPEAGGGMGRRQVRPE